MVLWGTIGLFAVSMCRAFRRSRNARREEPGQKNPLELA